MNTTGLQGHVRGSLACSQHPPATLGGGLGRVHFSEGRQAGMGSYQCPAGEAWFVLGFAKSGSPTEVRLPQLRLPGSRQQQG